MTPLRINKVVWFVTDLYDGSSTPGPSLRGVHLSFRLYLRKYLGLYSLPYVTVNVVDTCWLLQDIKPMYDLGYKNRGTYWYIQQKRLAIRFDKSNYLKQHHTYLSLDNVPRNNLFESTCALLITNKASILLETSVYIYIYIYIYVRQ